MSLTLELPPELEGKLREIAARSGQAPETFATAALVQTLRGTDPTAALLTDLNLEEFDLALDELARLGAGIPAPVAEESLTYSREDIYLDHD